MTVIFKRVLGLFFVTTAFGLCCMLALTNKSIFYFLAFNKPHQYDQQSLNQYMSRKHIQSSYQITPCKMNDRKNHLHAMCKLYGSKLAPAKRNTTFYISDELKVAYCNIEKHASSTFKKFLLTSTTPGRKRGLKGTSHIFKNDVLAKYGVRYAHYSPELMKELKDYTKIVILRNPFDRLLSVFADKIIANRYKDIKVRTRFLSILLYYFI